MSTPYKFGIAEDHNYWRHTLIEIIKNNFPEAEIVVEASNGKTLIEEIVASAKRSVPDMVILDLHMPDMDGYSTAKWLYSYHPEIKILTLSLLQDEKAIIRLLKYGVLGFLHKNINGDDLLSGIQSVLRGELYFSSFQNNMGVEQDLQLTSLLKVKDILEKWGSLSKLEKEFIRLCCTDKKYNEIAKELKIDISTIDKLVY